MPTGSRTAIADRPPRLIRPVNRSIVYPGSPGWDEPPRPARRSSWWERLLRGRAGLVYCAGSGCGCGTSTCKYCPAVPTTLVVTDSILFPGGLTANWTGSGWTATGYYTLSTGVCTAGTYPVFYSLGCGNSSSAPLSGGGGDCYQESCCPLVGPAPELLYPVQGESAYVTITTAANTCSPPSYILSITSSFDGFSCSLWGQADPEASSGTISWAA